MTLEAMVGKKASFGIFKLRKQICLQNDIYHIEQSEGIQFSGIKVVDTTYEVRMGY